MEQVETIALSGEGNANNQRSEDFQIHVSNVSFFSLELRWVHPYEPGADDSASCGKPFLGVRGSPAGEIPSRTAQWSLRLRCVWMKPQFARFTLHQGPSSRSVAR